MDLKEIRVHLDSQEIVVMLERKATRVMREILGQMDQRALKEPRETGDLKVKPEHQEVLGQRVELDLQVYLATQGPLV